VGEGLAGKAFKEGVPKKIDDLSKNEQECPMFARAGMKSVLAMPLRIGGKVEGVLKIGSLSKAAFSVHDWELMQVIADRASLAVQNSALHTQTRQELAKAALLRDVAAACASSLDIKEITNRTLDAIYEQLNCHRASIYYLDKKRNTLINLAFKGYTPKARDQFQILRLDQEALLARAIQEQRMITHKEVKLGDAKQPEAHTLKTLNIDSNHYCILPAIYKGEAVGAMVLVFADKRPLPLHVIETINSIADHLAVAIHSCARASQDTIDAAGIDSLESLPPQS
jgi:GAF domain-containing protein